MNTLDPARLVRHGQQHQITRCNTFGGEAFVLEYVYAQKRHIVLVDGGPDQTKSLTSARSPSYRDLISLLKTIWANDKAPIRLDAIINSYVHEDYYGGLLDLIELGGSVFDFSDTVFFAPKLDNQPEVDPRFRNFFKDINPSWNYVSQVATFVDGLIADSPSVQSGHVAMFTRKATSVAPIGSDAPLSVPTKSAHLLFKTESAKEVYFTGNSGIEKLRGTVNGHHFAIFQVSIQGSHGDGSHLKSTQFSTAFEVKTETMYYNLLAWSTERRSFLLRQMTHAPKDRWIEMMGQNFGAALGQDRDKTYQALKKRHFEFVTAYRNRKPNDVIDGKLPSLSPLPPNYSDLALHFSRVSRQSHYVSNPNSYNIPLWPNSKYTKPNPWFEDFRLNLPDLEYNFAYKVEQIFQFYKSFRSDVYVISGTGDSVEIISILIGLALACLDRPDGSRKSRLYMTNPGCLNQREDLRSYAAVFGYEPKHLFAGDGLEVFYLDDGNTISFDGDPEPTNPLDHVQRELGNHTRKVEFGSKAEELTEAMKGMLRHNGNSILKIIDNGSEARSFVIGLEGREQRSLGIKETTGPKGDVDKVWCWIPRTSADLSCKWLVRWEGSVNGTARLATLFVSGITNMSWLIEIRKSHFRQPGSNYFLRHEKDDALTWVDGWKDASPIQFYEHDSPQALADSLTSEPILDAELLSLIPQTGRPLLLHSSSDELLALTKYLDKMNVSQSERNRLDTVSAIAVLLDSQVAAVDIMTKIPSALLQTKLHNLNIDVSSSRVMYSATPLGTWSVSDFILIVDLLKAPDKDCTITLHIVKVRIQKISFGCENLWMSNQRMLLSCTAKLSISEAKSVTCTLTLNIGLEVPELICEIEEQPSLSTLAAITGVKEADLTTLPIPLTADSGSDSNKNLSAIPIKKVGFSTHQRIKSSDSLSLSSICVGFDIRSLKDYLPENFHRCLSSAVRAKAIISQPKEISRKVTVEARFLVGGKGGNKFEMLLKAESAGAAGSYEYTIEISDLRTDTSDVTRNKHSIIDVFKTFGLDFLTDFFSEIPLFKTLLGNIIFNGYFARLKKVEQKWQLADWTLKAQIDSIVLLPDQISIGNSDMQISRSKEGKLGGWGLGYLYINKLRKSLPTNFGLPHKLRPGSFKVPIGGGVSVSRMLETLSVHGFENVPFLGTLLGTGLEVLKLHFGQKASEDKDVKMMGIDVNFGLAQLEMGSLKLTKANVWILWKSQDHPDSQGNSIFTFEVKAKIMAETLEAEVVYDSTNGTITVTLRSVTPSKLIDLLRLVGAAETLGAFADVVGETVFKIATITFEVSGMKVTNFFVELADAAEMELQGVNDKSQIKLRSLTVSYSRTQTSKGTSSIPPELENSKNDEEAMLHSNGQNLANEASTELKISGTIGTLGRRVQVSLHYESGASPQPSKASLEIKSLDPGALSFGNVSSLLALRAPDSDSETPPGREDFGVVEISSFDGAIETYEGSAIGTTIGQDSNLPRDVSIMAKRNWRLSRLNIKVSGRSNYPIMDVPRIILDKLSLQVEYAVNTGIKFNFWGHLSIASRPFEVLFLKDKDHGWAFWASCGDDKLKDLELSEVCKKFLETDVDLRPPSGGQKPDKIRLANLEFVFIPKKLIYLNARGKDVWEGDFVNLKFKVVELGGMIKVTPKDAGNADKMNYEVHLTGKFSFIGHEGFASVHARLDVTPKANRLLTAALVTTDKAVDASDLITKLNSNPDEKWSKQSDGMNDLTFKGMAYLAIDFTKSCFLLVGELSSVGWAVIVGRKKPGKEDKGYFFSLEVKNLADIWPAFKDTVSSHFNINQIGLHVLTYETKPEDLRTDIKSLATQQWIDEVQRTTAIQADGLIDAAISQSLVPVRKTANDEIIQQADNILSRVRDGSFIPAWLPADNIDPGIWFFCRITTAGKEILSSSFAGSQSPGQEKHPNECIVIRGNKSKNAKTSTIYIDVQNFKLWSGTVVINGTGSYVPNGKSDSGGTNVPVVNIEASLELLGLNKEFKVKANYHVEPGLTTFAMTADGKNLTLHEPIKGMSTVTLIELDFKGRIEKGKTSYVLGGRVGFGKDSEIQSALTGAVLFENAKVRAVLLSYEKGQGLPVQKLCSKLLSEDQSGQQPAWPADHPNFGFQSAEICYLPGSESFEHNGVKYDPGFRLKAAVYAFGEPLSVGLDLDSAKTGITFSAAAEKELDLDFIKLGKHSTHAWAKGAAVVVKSTKSGNQTMVSIGVDASCKFFGSDPMDLTLRYKPSDKSLQGNLNFKVEWLGEKSDIKFTYKDGQPSFEGWNVSDEFKEFTTIADLIRKGSNMGDRGACGELVGLIFKAAVKTKFKFSITLPQAKHKDAKGMENSAVEVKDESSGSELIAKYKRVSPDGKIHLQLTWRYEITLAGSDPIVVPMGDSPLEFDPKSLKDGILHALKDLIQKNADKLAQSLTKPETLAKIAAILALERCALEILKSLLCRDVKAPEVDAAAATETVEGAEVVAEGTTAIGNVGKDVAEVGGVSVPEDAKPRVTAGRNLPETMVLIGGAVGAFALGTSVMVLYLDNLDFIANKTNSKKKEELKVLRTKLKKICDDDGIPAVKKLVTKVAEALSVTTPPTSTIDRSEKGENILIVDWKAVEKGLIDNTGMTASDLRWIIHWSIDPEFVEPSVISDATDTRIEIALNEVGVAVDIYVRVKATTQFPDKLFRPSGKVAENFAKYKQNNKDQRLSDAISQIKQAVLPRNDRVIEASRWTSIATAQRTPI